MKSSLLVSLGKEHFILKLSGIVNTDLSLSELALSEVRSSENNTH